MKGISVIIIGLLVPFILNAQAIDPEKTDFESKKLHEYKEYFLSNPETSKRFKKYNRARNAQRVVNYTALGIEAGTVIATVVTSRAPNDSSVPIGAILFITGTLMSATVAILGNLITAPIKRKHKRKLLEIENGTSWGGQSPNHQDPFIAVGITKYGVGVSYNF